LIVCKPITKQFLDFAPELVVEILSPATALKDRHTKFEIYQQQQILYYILVDIDTKKIEVWQLNETGKNGEVLIDKKKPQLFAFNNCSFSIVFDNIWS
jgi:Uma2 family endonuclease